MIKKRFSNERYVEAIWQLVGLSIIGIFFLMNHLTRNDWIQTTKEACEIEKRKQFSGVIDTCFEDNQNRGSYTALIKTRTGIIKYNEWNVSYPQAYFRTGDSIVKNADAFRYLIYRKGSNSLVIDEHFSCDYWEQFRQ